MKVYFNENGEFLKATGSSIFAESENSDVLELKLPMALANSVVYTTFLLPFPEDSEQYGNYKAESLLMTLTVDEQDGGIMWRGVLSAGYLVNAGIAYLSARVATQNGTIVKTTEQVKFEIGAGGAYQATPILPEQAEQLAEAIAQLQADVLDLQNDKQDKVDYTINLEQFPLENTVVGAINSIGEQVKTNTDDIETNTQDIAENRNDIDEIKQTMSTGENPIGTMTGNALPTDAQLNAFVEDNTDPSREPLVGDVIIFVLELAQETDKNYKYFYRGGTKGWSYYEIPPIEKASNVAYGILRGTYTVGATADTLVDISGGEIIAIWVKDTTVAPAQYRRVNDYANSLQTQIKAIISGSQVVGKATRAVQDESGNNIVDTYLTKANGASKLFVKDYALPRIFNDVYYLALGGYQKTVPTTPASGVQFETTTSAVGSFELFTVERQNSSDFEISAKNSSSNNIYVSANRDVGVRFRMTTQVSIQGGAWQTASVELTNKYTLDNGEIVKVPFSSFFNSLGDTVLELTTGDKFRQKLEVVTEESESTTFSVYSSETYPSSLNLNISSMSIIVAQGELGEQPTNVANGTKENSTITFELLESSKLNNNTECLFTFNFDGEIEGTDEVIAQYNGDDIRIVTPYNVEVGNPTIDEFNELMSKYDEQAGYSWEFKGFVKNDIDGIIIIVDMPNLHGIKEDIGDLYTETESIDNRVTTNEGNITTLQNGLSTTNSNVTALSGRVTTAESDIDSLGADIDTIEAKIPAQASSSNQLADKNFVNSTVQTASANFRGNWANWASVPMNADEYPADYAGVKTPSTNDYMVVQDASSYSVQTVGTWRFKYSGLWSTDGRNGWQPEYQVNETPLTAQQLAALNSGITSTLVEQIDHNEQAIADLEGSKQDLIDGDNKLDADLVDDTTSANKFVTSAEKSTWNGKQNALDTTQLSAVNSGITSTLVGKITTNETNITTLQTSKQNTITASNKLSANLIDDIVTSIADTPSNVKLTTESAIYNYIASGNNGKPRALSSIDLNTISATGFYSCNVCTNRPTENNGVMLVLKNALASDNVVQIYWTFTADVMWVRHKDLGNWKDWKKVINNEDLVTAINSSSTNDKIPTAKAVYDAIVAAETPIATTSITGKVKPDGTSITVDADGTVHAQSSGTAWGTITGTLSNQIDLQNALNGKQNSLDATQLSAVNSGANSTNIAQIATNTSGLSTVQTQINDIDGELTTQQTSINNLSTTLGNHTTQLINLTNEVSVRAKTDASNINVANYKSKLSFEQVETVYNKNSSDANINWGYTNGINGNITITGKNFSKYKYLLIYILFYPTLAGGHSTSFTLNLENVSNQDGNFYGNCWSRSSAQGNPDGQFSICRVNSAKTEFKHVVCGYNTVAENTLSRICKIEGVY